MQNGSHGWPSNFPQDVDPATKQAAVDAKHAELLEAYRHIFDTHKACNR